MNAERSPFDLPKPGDWNAGARQNARRTAALAALRHDLEPIRRDALREELRPIHLASLVASLAPIRAEYDAAIESFEVLSPWEFAELDKIAAVGRAAAGPRIQRARRAALVASTRWIRDSLVASAGAPGLVQGWLGVLAAENVQTGDGRLIAAGALVSAALPMPLRWSPTDTGGHNGAVVVGRIDRIARGDDGLIRGAGVLDLGSDAGQECVRLIAGRFLRGVSIDTDSTDTEAADLGGSVLAVIGSGRIRAVTIVAIPAFDEASIALIGDPMPDPGPSPASPPDSGSTAPADPADDDLEPLDHFHPATPVAGRSK